LSATLPAGRLSGFRAVEVEEILGTTGDAVAAVDHEQRVVGWNQAAADLVGYTADEVLGRPCNEVLAWWNRCGDAVCCEDCVSPARAAAGEVLETREVMGRSAKGATLWLNVTTVVPPVAAQETVALLHLMREVSLPPELERLVAERLERPEETVTRCEALDLLEKLTPREREILKLLSDGLGTTEIAQQLVVAPATVRNHIQNLLAKLDVRSRLEAVALVLRHSG
jgi:PAS domain S-box-containing protein